MKVENTNWEWLINDSENQEAYKHLYGIKLSVIRAKDGSYRLCIRHSLKYSGNTYYMLGSKDMTSACNEANLVAKEEFRVMKEWYENLIGELNSKE